jgi:hypothetical protein
MQKGNFPSLNLTQRLVYADDDNISGGSVHTIKKKTEVLVVDGKKVDLEVNADKTKYMVMSRDQIAGLSHSINTASSSFERVEQFKYLGTTLKNENCLRKKLRVD